MVIFDSLEFTVKSNLITVAINGIRGTSFMLHYEVPTYITNEIDEVIHVSRKELGHGALTDKAFYIVIHKDTYFHYESHS